MPESTAAEIEQKYNQLGKNYSLPVFKEIDNLFEISTFQHHSFLLRNIRRTISERLDHYAKILSELLQPEANMKALQESSSFTEKEKQEMLVLYKHLMHLFRLSQQIEFSQNEEKDAEYINLIFQQWLSINTQFFKLSEKLAVSWQKQEKWEEDIMYMG
ncbi:hypothetical protein HZA96_04770 [Candidatus Woesearchaeota archaeon]|nr:hypothetical protein [Candidatus Woesearchaeota archaeon]